jgi:hypothetical protein
VLPADGKEGQVMNNIFGGLLMLVGYFAVLYAVLTGLRNATRNTPEPLRIPPDDNDNRFV